MDTEVITDALKTGYTLVQQYEIITVLGQGGFGITYLARDLRLDQKVAIKEYLPESLASRDRDFSVRPKTKEHVSDFKAFKERFLDEARTLARFKHPNMVRIQNYFEAVGTAYFVMEYEEGEPLDAKLTQSGKLKEKAVMNIVLPLMSGLEVLHDAGMIHRDIKPANIYLRKDGSPVLLDFGAARAEADSGGKTSMTSMLTPGYAPIEQYYTDAKQQGAWSDIYAMAGVIYRCITGRRVVEASLRSAARLRDEPDPMKPATKIAKKRYQEHFLRAIDHALMVLGEERPQSIEEWRKELKGQVEAPLPEGCEPSEPVELAPEERTIADLSLDELMDDAGEPTRHKAKPKGKAKAKKRKRVVDSASNTGIGRRSRDKKENTTIGGKRVATGKRSKLPLVIGLCAMVLLSAGVGYWKVEILDKMPWVDPVTGQTFIYIPAGCFSMGSKNNEEGRYADEHPHNVCVDSFWLSKHETTQGAWGKVLPDNPSTFDRGSRYPVDKVSFKNVRQFIGKLNKMGDDSFRLPTEAEWEYAARATLETPYPWGDKFSEKKTNCGECATSWSNISTTKVGSFKPNLFQLYDMHGNVSEWTCSPLNEAYDGAEKRCAGKKGNRVARGGNWSSSASDTRSAYRMHHAMNYRTSTLGFRLVRR
ncbi:MAG: SUMF1/EgtB/PvdO family nonheme iron enzyme [Methylococcales bacterium]|nr:SUMF1/EgtB/PvdO family nonheme iron enzyme [Methylococcales bacterium]